MTDSDFEVEPPSAVETDRYGASDPTAPIPPRSDSWSSAPAWSTRRSLPSEPPEPTPTRRPRLLGFIALSLAAGVVAGSLSGLAVVNLVGLPEAQPSSQPPAGEVVNEVTLDEASRGATLRVRPSSVEVNGLVKLDGAFELEPVDLDRAG